EVECLVLNDSGMMKYVDDDIPSPCVTGVMMESIARLQRLAGHALARSLVDEAANGAVLSAIGAVDQLLHNLLSYSIGTLDHLLELLRLLASLGDQIHLIHMVEPAHVQMQDLLTQPFRKRAISEDGKFASSMKAKSWFQCRILKLPAALAQTHLSGGELNFN